MEKEETVEERNKREGWGCKCHGMTFCPDLVFVGYDDDQPVFKRKDNGGKGETRNT